MRISPKSLAMAAGLALVTAAGLSVGQSSDRGEYVVQQSRGAHGDLIYDRRRHISAAKIDSETGEELGMTSVTYGSGERDDPWLLKTPPLSSEYQAWRDTASTPPRLVVQVGQFQKRWVPLLWERNWRVSLIRLLPGLVPHSWKQG